MFGGTLKITFPLANDHVKPGPLNVSGVVTDSAEVAPATVTIQVGGGDVVDADLNVIEREPMWRASFSTPSGAIVLSNPGRYLITVTATDDIGSEKETVQVFVGTSQVVAPALLLEFAAPSTDLNFSGIVGKFQQAFAGLAPLLSPDILAGPNMIATTNRLGDPIVRIGMWIVGSTFPLVPANPPDFPLPVLTDDDAAAGFKSVPLLDPPQPNTVKPIQLGFAVSIPTLTLQILIDTLMPTLVTLAAQKGVRLTSVAVTCRKPSADDRSAGHEGFVTTSIAGTVASTEVSGSITEVLGRLPVPAMPPLSVQFVPAIVDSSSTSSPDILTQVFFSLFFPFFSQESLVISILTAIGVGSASGKATGIATSLIGGIPSTIPFRNEDSQILPCFPLMVPDWIFFGVDDLGISARGRANFLPRDETMVSLNISGPRVMMGTQQDLSGGTSQNYSLAYPNLAPDKDKFTFSVSGDNEGGPAPIRYTEGSQTTNINVNFPLPVDLKAGHYRFQLTANAVETCGTDPSQTLTASTSVTVFIKVLKGHDGN